MANKITTEQVRAIAQAQQQARKERNLKAMAAVAAAGRGKA